MIFFRRAGWLIFFGFALVFPLFFPNPAIMTIAVSTLLFATAAVGWNLFSGYTGYISLGHGTFFGIGAYTIALLCQDWNIQGGYTPFLLLPLAGIVVAVFAFPLGWIALRTRRQTFVIITLAFFFIGQLLAYNLRSITNGSTGISLPNPPWSSDFFNTPFYFVSLAVLLLSLIVSWWIRHSKYGLTLLAIRDDEDRTLGLGVNVEISKITALAVSACFAGIGGGIYAYFVGSLYPQFAFDPTVNVGITLMALLGGLGTLSGPILGAVIVTPVQQYLVLQFGANGWYQIIYGFLFLVILLALPEGIVPALQKRGTRLFLYRNRTKKIISPVTDSLSPENSAVAKQGKK